MKSLKQIKEEMMAANSKSFSDSKQLKSYFLRVPNPEKEAAKQAKCKWNSEKMLYELKTNDIENHPLKHLLADSEFWIKLKGEIHFQFQEELKNHGVVKSQNSETHEWESWVLAHEKYIDLINTLTELELL